MEKASIGTIGQAGENQVAIACSVLDKHSFAGRCSFGAVMGPKKLREVVAKGTQKVAVNDKEKLSQVSRDIGRTVHENTKELTVLSWQHQNWMAVSYSWPPSQRDGPVGT